MPDVLVLYAKQDQWYRDWLEKHLQVLEEQHDYLDIHYWTYPQKRFDRRMARESNRQRFQEAEVLLLLLSPDFLRSGLYANNLKRRVLLHKKKEVIPLLLCPCLWRQESFFLRKAGFIEAQQPLNQVRSMKPGERQKIGIRLEGDLLSRFWKKDRLDIIELIKKKEKVERQQRERLHRWAVRIGAAVVGALIVFLTFFSNAPKNGARPSPPATEHRRSPEQPPPETKAGFLRDRNSAPPFKAQPPEDTGESTIDSDPPSTTSFHSPEERFTRIHPLGAGRLAGLQADPQGWMLLDLDTVPVVDALFRRMDLDGFWNGRLKVKQGEETIFIAPDGKRTGRSVGE